MVNNLLQLLTPLRNLLVISHLNSLLTPSNLRIPSSLPTLNLPTLSSQPTHSHLPMVSSLPILKVLQLGLNRRLRGSASSSVLKASRLSLCLKMSADVKCAQQITIEWDYALLYVLNL